MYPVLLGPSSGLAVALSFMKHMFNVPFGAGLPIEAAVTAYGDNSTMNPHKLTKFPTSILRKGWAIGEHMLGRINGKKNSHLIRGQWFCK